MPAEETRRPAFFLSSIRPWCIGRPQQTFCGGRAGIISFHFLPHEEDVERCLLRKPAAPPIITHIRDRCTARGPERGTRKTRNTLSLDRACSEADIRDVFRISLPTPLLLPSLPRRAIHFPRECRAGKKFFPIRF